MPAAGTRLRCCSQGKRMRSASIKRAVQATALGNLCAAKQDFKPRSEPGFLPVENGRTGLSAPKIEAPDLMRLPWLGRRRKTDLRRVFEAMLYLLTTGCQWRLLPTDFPPYHGVALLLRLA